MIGQYDNINLEVHEKKNVFLRLYGIVYIFILACIIGFGYYYLNSIEYFAHQKVTGETLFKKDTTQNIADLSVVKGAVSPPVDVNKLLNATQEQVSKGKELFTTNCSGCHGNEGKGDGLAAASMNPKPRNFTTAEGWKNGTKPSQIYKTLQEGLTATGMPSFAQLSPEDRFALIHFIQSLNPTLPKATADEVKELDKTYNLSAGFKSPNQIPVKSAMEKILQENGAKEESIKKILTVIENDNNPAGILFKSIVVNREKAVRTLVSSTKWLENETDFVNIINTGVITNGFRTSVYNLSQQDISQLHQYLKILFSANFNLQTKS